MGLLGGINLYQYAPNPVEWIDPWGWKHTAIWELVDKLGNLKGAGIEFSGSDIPPGRRLNWNEQLGVHTERKIINKIRSKVEPGDTLRILGEKPPCNPGGRGCHSAMADFAKEKGIRVIYMTTDEEWNFGVCR
nr:hypothetical protein [Taylorella equigenitalis]